MGITRIKEFMGLSLFIMALCCLLALSGCDGDDSNYDPGGPASFDTVVGPEGGMIEVTDLESNIYGLKIVIPEGALTGSTTITVTSAWNAPALPDGLESGNPVIELEPDVSFVKPIQIVFPLQDSPETSENIFCAFYFDTSDPNDAKWTVVMPESLTASALTVQAQHFSFWRWGELDLDEAEPEIMDPLYDLMYGDNFFIWLETMIDNEFKDLDFANYCDNQQEIYNFLVQKKVDAEAAVTEALTAVGEVCDVRGLTPNDFLSAEISHLVDVNLTYIIADAFLGPGPVYEILEDLGIVGTHPILLWYQGAMEEIGSNYMCIWDSSDSTLWGNIWLYYGADAAMLAMVMAEQSEYSCN